MTTEAPSIISERMMDAESRVAAGLLFTPDTSRIAAAIAGKSLFTDPLRSALVRVALDELDKAGGVDWSKVGERVIREGNHSAAAVEGELRQLAEWSAMAYRERVDGAVAELIERKNAIEIERLAHEITSGTCYGAIEARERMREILDRQERAGGTKMLTLADTLISDPSEEACDIIQTGIKGLDAMLPDGGLHLGDKIAMAGLPGAGKTALGLQVACSTLITNPKLRAVWALGEMTPKALRNRALQCLSGLTIGCLRREYADLTDHQAQAKREAVEILRSIADRLFIVEGPLTPGRIEAGIAHSCAGLLVVDYLQLCRPDTETGTRRDDVDGVIRSLTTIANRRGVASFWLSSMPKSAADRKGLYDVFKESSEIAHACDLAYLLDPLGAQGADAMDVPDVVDIRMTCLKARHGAPLSGLLRFDRPCQRFTFAPREGLRF